MTTTMTSPVSADTAADHVALDVPVFPAGTQAGSARRSLIGRRYTSTRDLAVCEEGRLVGLVTIESLLAAGDSQTLAELMDPDPPSIGPDVDQEVAAWQMVHHGESSLAVVDGVGRFVGLIPPTRMLEVLLREHEEDLSRLGGFLHDAASARLASSEAIGRRLLHRLPWLVVGLVGAFASALLLKGFEARLADSVELAFFIPGIVYLAGAVGTQTETLVVRGLSVGVPVGGIVRSEMGTGAVVAVLLAALTFPFALMISSSSAVAWTVTLAILASCGTATMTGTALPRFLTAIGQDPAFGSGPMVTIIQDLLSIAVYLVLALVII